MPVPELMSWEPKRRRWIRMHRGKRLYVSCKALGVPETKEASVQAANAWWRAKQAELDAAVVPPPRPPQPLDDVIGAMLDPRVLTSGESAYRLLFEAILDHHQTGGLHLPEKLAEAVRTALGHSGLKVQPLDEREAEALRQNAAEELLRGCVIDGESLPKNVQQSLPPARVNQLQDATKAIRGESVVPAERTVGSRFEKWLELKISNAQKGAITPNRVANIRTSLAYFRDFLGAEAEVNTIDGDRLEAFYNWISAKVALRLSGSADGWSDGYAERVFLTAKAFVRYLWRSNLIELPRNIDSKDFYFDNTPQEVVTWTREECQHVIGEARGQLKLHLLLMVNCGMTQKDISDLREKEIDWKLGTITRKRSKTKKKEDVPKVCYKLWPQTFKLLCQYRSGKDRVLLTTRGNPWVRAILVNDKLKAADSIHAAFNKLRDRLKFHRRLKELRKTSTSLLDKHPEFGRYSTHFLGHSPRSMKDKHYSKPDQDRFDAAIAWLGSELGLA